MTINNAKLGSVLGVTLLTITALSTTSCEDENNPINAVAQQCGLTCPARGVAEGNASITGFAGIDQFFGSVVRFQRVGAEVTGSIDAEIKAIQGAFNITPAELTAAGAGGVNAAIKAKITAAVDAGFSVRYQPARCEIDAKAAFEAKAECEVAAGCNAMVTPGSVNVECRGSCEVDASVMARCAANVKTTCTVRAPSFMCTGQCTGQCTVSGQAAASCQGTCNGQCMGTCSVKNTDGSCAGQCDGTCMGSCTLAAEVTAQCNGSCSGECQYDPGAANCDASAEVRCEAAANASVMCQGSCDGEVVPPMVNASCNAEASCDASVKAEASLDVQCTPPSVDVAYRLKAAANAQLAADVRFGLNTLEARLPSLLASLRKAELVFKAGGSLLSDASGAITTSANTLVNADVDLVVKARVGCAVAEATKVPAAIGGTSEALKAQIDAAAALQAAFKL